jgi:hypothetical protein
MNKQIEEMAKDIRKAEMDYLVAMVTADIDDAIDGAAPRDERLATALYELGYRKASDVAEQFKEIAKQYLLEKGLYLAVFKNALNHAEAELKKKYESEGTDDE